MKTKKSGDNCYDLILQCNHIIEYTTLCKKCGNAITTINRVVIPECPTCKNKNLEPSKPVYCKNVAQYGFGDLGDTKKTNDQGKRIHEILKTIPKKNLKNINKPDEYYCDKHAVKNNGGTE